MPEVSQECSLNIQKKFRNGGSLKNENIGAYKPCKSDRGKILLDKDLKKQFDSKKFSKKVLTLLLDLSDNLFEEIIYSKDLGVFKINFESHNIWIYNSGKLEVRMGSDKVEMKKISETLEKIICGGLVCKNCKSVFLKCLRKNCSVCLGEESIREFKIPEYYSNNFEMVLNKLKNVEKPFTDIDTVLENLRKIYDMILNYLKSITYEYEFLYPGLYLQSILLELICILKEFQTVNKKQEYRDEKLSDLVRKGFNSSVKVVDQLLETKETKVLVKNKKNLRELKKQLDDYSRIKRNNISKVKTRLNNTLNSNIFYLDSLIRFNKKKSQ